MRDVTSVDSVGWADSGPKVVMIFKGNAQLGVAATERASFARRIIVLPYL